PIADQAMPRHYRLPSRRKSRRYAESGGLAPASRKRIRRWIWPLRPHAPFASVFSPLPLSRCSPSSSARPDMPSNPYNENLDKNAANYQPLTPLQFLQRAALVYPTHTAIIHGNQRFTYAEFYARCRRLASALKARGIKPGDTVSVMLANTPPMLEAHYGVAMTRAVPHTINTRLCAPIVAFQLDHANSKLFITDREFATLSK